MTENNENIIQHGFSVLRFKERITTLGYTPGFYNFSGSAALLSRVVALEGYTEAMEKELTELEGCIMLVGVDVAGHRHDSVDVSYISSGSVVVNDAYYTLLSGFAEGIKPAVHVQRDLVVSLEETKETLMGLAGIAKRYDIPIITSKYLASGKALLMDLKAWQWPKIKFPFIGA